MLPALLLVLIGVSGQPQTPAQADAKPVTLARVAKANEKLSYQLSSRLHVDVRQVGLETWIPQTFDLSYGFTTDVASVSPGGMIVEHYLRPLMVETEGETADSPPKTQTEKVNLNLMLTISPINEIVSVKDLTPAKPSPKKADSGGGDYSTYASVPIVQKDFIGQFVSEIYRLALNAGSLDSALDFSPKLPLDDVKPGDTWKHTVGYSPQKLKDSKDKNAVQRMDYTYTYQGLVDSDGKKVRRVTADLDLNTNLADFLHQLVKQTPQETGIKEIMLNIKSHIDFDLDPTTCETLKAVSSSTGGFSITLTEHPDQPLHEERFKGEGTLKLVGRS